MNWKKFLRTWEGVRLENIWLRSFIGGLMVITLMLGFLVSRKETTVIIQPFTLTEEAWVSSKQSSQSYQEAWGLALAQLIGNVNPATVGFLKERIGPVLAPAIYQEVIDAIELQAADIKKDRITMRFEPRTVVYEDGRVFVEGTSFLKAATGQEKGTRRVYEFLFSTKGYRLEVDYLTTYQGRARVSEVVEREFEQAERRRQQAERKDKRG